MRLVRVAVQPVRHRRCRAGRRRARRSACGPRGSDRAECRTRRDPRHRRRDDRAAGRAGRRHGGDPRPALPPVPTRRRPFPGSSSSTPPRWLASCSTPPARRSPTRAADAVTAVGITNQRASTIVWDRATGRPIGPALGWQDLRTVGECIMAKAEHGLPLAPNQSATKIAWLLANTPDGARSRPVLRHGRHVGRVDAVGGRGARHRPLERGRHRPLRPRRLGLERPGVRPARHPDVDPAVDRRLVGRDRHRVGAARRAADRGAGRRPAGVAGRPGLRPSRAWPRSRSAPAGCSTCARAAPRPATANRTDNGTFPIVAWSRAGELTWGVEAVMLSAGTNVEWLRDDLGLIATERREPRRRRRVRDDRRRRVRARPARARHAALGLRRTRDAARPDPRHRPAARGARRARGHRPPRRRHGGRRRGRHRAARSRRCASTAG